MARKLQTQFWVNMEHAVLGRCTLIHFDGDSYRDKALVQFEDGVQDRVKIGWLSRRSFNVETYEGFKPVHPLQVHVMSGKRREDYVARSRKTEWKLFYDGMPNEWSRSGQLKHYDTLYKAVNAAFAVILNNPELDHVILDCARRDANSRHTVYDSSQQAVTLYRDFCMERTRNKPYNGKRLGDGLTMRHSSFPGFGKGSSYMYHPRRVWFAGKRQKQTYGV